jgi:hypothetical protein
MLRLVDTSLPAHRDALRAAGTPGCGRTTRTASTATFVVAQP